MEIYKYRKGDIYMDERCVLCKALYDKCYDGDIYRLGGIDAIDFRPALFHRLSMVTGIQESGNYYFFDGLVNSLLANCRLKEVMGGEDFNIRKEHLVQKTIYLYTSFLGILENEMYFICTTLWYKQGKYYAQTLDKRVSKLLALISKWHSDDLKVFEIDMDKLVNNDIREVWELIK